MIPLSLILILIIILLIIYHFYHRLNYFNFRSIPSPPIRSLLFGHLYDLWSVPLYSHQIREWTKKYGSIYGLFEGTRPLYVLSDIKLIEEVFVKQFHRFHSRRKTLTSRLLGSTHSNVFSSTIFEQWKRQRTILNPTYSGAKMRRLLPTIDTCVHLFLEQLNSISSRRKQSINIYQIYKRLTMDVICRSAFGIDTKIQHESNNENNIYMKKIEEVFANDFERTSIGKIHRILSNSPFVSLCPSIYRLTKFIEKFFSSSKSSTLPANLWLIEHMAEFIQLRTTKTTQSNSSMTDLLQLMIDAFHSNKNIFSSTELLSNVFIVLLAGFETTSTALAYCTFHLIENEEYQQKIYQELIENYSSDIDLYDLLNNKLIYLDLFIREVLRLHPIAVQAVHRQCFQNTSLGKYFIEKDSLIQIDVLSVHFNEELWGPLPVEEFHPERHLIKRNPLAFLPFGGGPRLCLGMRFALLEIKLALIRLINEYRLIPIANESNDLKLIEEIVITPEQIQIQLEKRIDSFIRF